MQNLLNTHIAGLLAAACVPAVFVNPVLAAEADTLLPNVTVVGERDELQRVTIDPLNTSQTSPTTGELMKRIPGGNLNFNGPLTGIGQYRGMYAYRLNTQVDGMSMAVGGPNWMDAPLHSAPMPLLKSLEVQRGITPVSAGNETIGGNVRARTKKSEFTASSDFGFHGNLNASARTADGGYGLGAVLAGSNDTHRMHVSGVAEKGDDTKFADGKIHPTEYQRNMLGLGYGLSLGNHELGLDYSRNETADSGTPALPMDIRYIDTDTIGVQYSGVFGRSTLITRLNYNEVEHLMDNFGLREAPANAGRYRQNLATGDGTGFELSALTEFSAGNFSYGVDGNLSNHDSRITNPNNAIFFVEAFNGVSRDRVGLFGEWRSPLSEAWAYELGTRYTRVDADAGEVDGTPAMMMPAAASLRDEFNAAERKLDWGLLDAVAKLSYQASATVSIDLGVARKGRAPEYQELYLWLPLQATAGLADGKNYVGNLELKQETANTIDLGFDWRNEGSFFGPRVFYKRVSDYIQGTPSEDPRVIMISTMNGDSTPLQFNNVDAELYGLDADFGVQMPAGLRFDGVISYVRGKRRDISDNLYRIAPLTSVVGLTLNRARWSATLEGQFASKQDKVSATNEETPTAGYGIANLYGSIEVSDGLIFGLGLNNLFDKKYRDHTNGVNRVTDSDVEVGERLPGAGRSFFARINYNW